MSNIINCIYSTVRSLCQSPEERAAEESDRRYFRLEPELMKAIDEATAAFWKKHGRAPTLEEDVQIDIECYQKVFHSRGLDGSRQYSDSFGNQMQKSHSAAAFFLVQSSKTKPKSE